MSERKIQCAWDTDLKKALLMVIDEVSSAYAEALADLTDEQFAAFPVEGRHCIATLTYHCIQQGDDFNAVLMERFGETAAHGPRFLVSEVRFGLWGVPESEWPKRGDKFPTADEARAALAAITGSLMRNLERLSEEDLIAPAPEKWPRLCDMFFRLSNHWNAHIRQIWALRGVMGLAGQKSWPDQHWA